MLTHVVEGKSRFVLMQQGKWWVSPRLDQRLRLALMVAPVLGARAEDTARAMARDHA